MRMGKRLLSGLLALALALSLPLGVLAQEAQAARTEVHVATAEQLLQLANNCQLDDWSRERVVYLDADLDLTGLDFGGIPSFGGRFEGQGHTIRGMSFEQDGAILGFVRYLQQGAVLRDLSLYGTVLPGGSKKTLGGLVAVNSGTVEGCTFYGAVGGSDQIGGLVGVNETEGVICLSTAYGTVYGEHFVGGIVGENRGVVYQCVNGSGVNTTVEQNEVDLADLSLADITGTESAATITDIGGIAGTNSGVLRACVNTGTVGYEHIGYNVGGIAGGQTGYMEGCVNTGSIFGRKEVGGIAGQMEPERTLTFSQERLEQLREELRTLKTLVDRTADDASAATAELNANLKDLQSRINRALDTVETLLNAIKDLDVDLDRGNLKTNIEDLLEDLKSQLPDLPDLPDLLPTPDPNATARPLPIPTPGRTQAPAETEEPQATAAPTPAPTEPAAEPTPAQTEAPVQTEPPAEQEGTEQQEDAEQTQEATQPAEALPAPAQPDGQTQADGMAWSGTGSGIRLLRVAGRSAESGESAPTPEPTAQPEPTEQPEPTAQPAPTPTPASTPAATLTPATPNLPEIDLPKVDWDWNDVEWPHLEVVNQDQVTAAHNTLNSDLDGLSDSVNALTDSASANGDRLSQDIQDICDQLDVIFDLIIDELEDVTDEDEDRFEDVSDSDTDGQTTGKVYNCQNSGSISGDLNVGGIAGTMGYENDLDPEDDIELEGNTSLNYHYKTRVVIRECQNEGTVTGQKRLVGGIVGSMDMGTVLECFNNGSIRAEECSYVGGIAGRSAGSIRSCYAKCTILAENQVGGIAGSGQTIRDCCSMVTLDGGNQCVGAIAGTVEDGWPQDAEEITGNLFVQNQWGGIDGVSYLGKAEPVSYPELVAQRDLPEDFAYLTVTFVAEDVVVNTRILQYGQRITDSMVPEVPQKEGYTGQWVSFARVVSTDMTIEAQYTYSSNILESSKKQGERAVLIAEGSFGTGAVMGLVESDQWPGLGHGESCLESWSVTLPQDGQERHTLRYLIPEGESSVAVYCNAGQGWQRMDAVQDGSYLVFEAEGSSFVLCSLRQTNLLLVLVAGAVLLLVLLVLLHVMVRRRRARRMARGKKPQKQAHVPDAAPSAQQAVEAPKADETAEGQAPEGDA